MIEIQAVSPSYSVKKPNKIIRDPAYQPKKKQATKEQLEDEEDVQSSEQSEKQHINEIV
ncbi:MAG: hypothetical protein KAT04_00215 [Methylococcales bacterium]|nr:hypothetical protein [Methylococcales bacterium]